MKKFWKCAAAVGIVAVAAGAACFIKYKFFGGNE